MRSKFLWVVPLLLALASPADAASAACTLDQPIRVTASWYGPGHHGRPTASGELFNQGALTAAHPCLPFGTIVDVHDTASGRSVRVRINDRGPFKPGRHIDLSKAAAAQLGIDRLGLGRVSLSRVVPTAAICPRHRPCGTAPAAAKR